MRLALGKKALDILLEVKAVDDNGLGRLRLGALLRLGFVTRHDRKEQLFRIRGPAKVSQIVLDVGELLGLTSAAVEQPHLRALGVALAAGGEGEKAAVGAPARVAGAVLAAGELDVLCPVPAHHPEVGEVLVFAGVHVPHGVGDPLDIGRDLRRSDADHLPHVIEGHAVLRGRRLGRRWIAPGLRVRGGQAQRKGAGATMQDHLGR